MQYHSRCPSAFNKDELGHKFNEQYLKRTWSETEEDKTKEVADQKTGCDHRYVTKTDMEKSRCTPQNT